MKADNPGDIIIYFDMDGVLADFDAGKDSILGRPTPELNRPTEEMTPAQKDLKQFFWHKIETHPSFFKDLPPLSCGLALYQSLGAYKRVILTASPEFGGVDSIPFRSVASQKYEWCQDHLGQVHQADFICTLSHLKHQYLGKHGGKKYVLIDDRASNCEAWTGAGGIAVHHDPANPDQTIETLRQLGIQVANTTVTKKKKPQP